MSDEEERWQRLIEGLRRGEGQVIREFCEQYGSALERLAERHLAPGLRRRIDPEDIVQSACRTFLRRAHVGQFQLEDSEALWQLLCAITLAKVREHVRFHRRQRRALGQERPLAGEADSQAGFQPVDSGLSPAEATEFADQYEHVLAGLDEEDRQVLELKLQECTNDQVAEQMGLSERTVRRLVKRIRARFARAFENT